MIDKKKYHSEYYKLHKEKLREYNRKWMRQKRGSVNEHSKFIVKRLSLDDLLKLAEIITKNRITK